MTEIFLIDNAIVFDGADSGQAQTPAQNTNTGTGTAQTPAQADAQVPAGGGIGFVGMMIYIVGLIAVFYLFVIRPQKKRETELKELQNAVKVGDSVLTASGFYGRVTDIYSDTYVIEFGLNKGVRVPVSKSEVIGIKEPNLTFKAEKTEQTDK